MHLQLKLYLINYCIMLICVGALLHYPKNSNLCILKFVVGFCNQYILYVKCEVNIPRQDPSNKIYYMFPLSSVGGFPQKKSVGLIQGMSRIQLAFSLAFMKDIICLLIDCLDSVFIRKAFGHLQHTNVVHIHNFVCNDIL